MRFSFLSGTRNDLIQLISDQTLEIENQTFSPIKGRNAAAVTFGGEGFFAGSVTTTHETYTVSTGKYAIVSNMSVGLVRTVAASSAERNRIKITHATSGSVEIAPFISYMRSNSVGARINVEWNGSFIMFAGEKLIVIDQDFAGDGGGIVWWSGSITEFDV